MSASERRRAEQLRRAKALATGLLLLSTAVFAASSVLVHEVSWLPWVQATALASMVGALADWFAVTALFRRPLGLPIPHTAIVVERKDRFAETLGAFVQENFLSPEAVNARLRGQAVVSRAAVWLADPDHASDVAARTADALVASADLLAEEDVQSALHGLLRARLETISLAPVAGRALAGLIRDGRHDPLLDAALAALGTYLEKEGPRLHRRLGAQSPWWLPGPVEGRMMGRLIRRSSAVLTEMAADRDHPLRAQLDAGLHRLARDLQSSEELCRRGEELKGELLSQPELRGLAVSVWRDAKRELREQAARPGSELHTWLAGAVQNTGERLRDDPQLAESAERGLEGLAKTVLGRFDVELAGLVSGTIGRWDASETSRRLELLLGPDLQYIRINGTVVGAAAGLAIYAIGRALG